MAAPMRPVGGIFIAAACAGLCTTACERGAAGKAGSALPTGGAAPGRSVVLATVPGPVRPPAPPAASGTRLHMASSGGTRDYVFAERGAGVAFAVEADGKFRVIHNGLAGKPYSAIGELVVSADGRRHAYGALVDGAWRMVVDGAEGAPFSAVDDPVFSPDGAHVAYQGMQGELWHLVVDEVTKVSTRTHYLDHEFSGDASRLALIDDVDDNDWADRGRLVIRDLALDTHTVVDTGATTLLRSQDGKRVAAVCEMGKQERVLTLAFDRPTEVRRARPYDHVGGLVLTPDGHSVAYLGERSGRSLVVLDGREQLLPPGSHVISPLIIRHDRKAVGAIVAASEAARFQEFFLEAGPAAPGYAEAEGPVYGPEGNLHAYAASRGGTWRLVVNGREGPPFDRVVSPAVSPDGRRLVYRARQDGRRFVVVAGLDGQTIRQHPAYEQVFPVRFTGEGREVAYGVKDGQELAWKVEPL